MYADNLKWIEEAASHQLVVGSQARILYSAQEGRVAIAVSFNKVRDMIDIRSGFFIQLPPGTDRLRMLNGVLRKLTSKSGIFLNCCNWITCKICI